MHLKVRTRLNGSVCAYWNIFLSNHIHIPDRAVKGGGGGGTVLFLIH